MSKEKTEPTTLEKAQARYAAACREYDKKVHVPTAQMNPAQKKEHLDACTKLLAEKRRLKAEINALLSNRQELRI